MRGEVNSAFLLCGGQSERLGFPKELLRVQGAPLAVAMVNRLRDVFSDVCVVTNDPAYLRRSLAVPIQGDEYPGLGPLAGIHAGLKRTRGKAAFFLACDMPLVTSRLIRRLLEAAAKSSAPALVARTPRRAQPLCGVYSTDLAPALAKRLETGRDLGLRRFLKENGADYLDFTGEEAACFRDVDSPEDLPILQEAFGQVEPLPVRRVQIRRAGRPELQEDLLAVERTLQLYLNYLFLTALPCLPNALRELAVGHLLSLGLIESYKDVKGLSVDYELCRATAETGMDVGATIAAARLLRQPVAPAPREVAGIESAADFRLSARRLLELADGLRQMAPVFQRTGATHQAAITDGERVISFHEDVSRHSALDKVVGECLIRHADLSRTALLLTGRACATTIARALRAGIPVVVSRGAPTQLAVDMAEERGQVLAGFARQGRLNIYTRFARAAALEML